MDEAVSMQTMVDPYQASKLRDAFYWRSRCESAEKELDRLRDENEKYRVCLEAVMYLRHALRLIDREADAR